MAPTFKLRIESRAARAIADQAEYYLSREGPSLAQRWQASVDETMRSLAKFPERGAQVHTGSSRFRSVRHIPVPGFPNHAIYYMVAGEVISVLHVLHGARHLTSAFAAPENDP